MRRVWMVFAAVMICWGVQAQEGFDAKMRRAGLVDVLAVDSTLRVKLMYSAPLPHFARKVAAAQRLLRERRPGWRLLVCDAARPVSVQRQMYELVKGTPNQVYVADGTRGGRHNYGVAVDVTLLDETGAPVDMGTPVDFFGDEAHTGDEPALAAEGRISAEACRNRQLLGSVMREAGLVPYRREWWHYEEPMAMSEVRTRYKLLDF